MANRPRRKKSVPRAAPLAAGLDDPAVIDTVLRHEERHDVLLAVQVSRAWEAADGARLKKKIGAYINHITSDGLAKSIPDWHQGTVTIGVHAAEEPPEAFTPLWERYAHTLRNQYGIGFEMCVIRGANDSETLIETPGHTGTGPEGAMRGGWAFASHIADRMNATGTFDAVSIDDALTIQCEAGGATFTASLDNLWRACKGKGAATLAEEAENFVAALASRAEGGGDDAAISARILPVLRPIERMHEIAALAAQHGALAPAEIHEPFSDEIVLSYVIDDGPTMQSLSPDEAQDYAADWRDLHNLAVGNLRERARDALEVHTLEEGIFMVAIGGDYESGLLCLAPVWGQLAPTVEGDVIAAVPTRDLLFFTGSKNTQAVDALRLRAEEFFRTADHAVAPGLLRLTSNGWVDA